MVTAKYPSFTRQFQTCTYGRSPEESLFICYAFLKSLKAVKVHTHPQGSGDPVFHYTA